MNWKFWKSLPDDYVYRIANYEDDPKWKLIEEEWRLRCLAAKLRREREIRERFSSRIEEVGKRRPKSDWGNL